MSEIMAVIFDCFGVLYPQAGGNFFKRHTELFVQDTAALDRLNVQIDLGKISRKEYFEGLEDVVGVPANSIQSEIDSELVYDQNLIRHISKLKEKYKIGLLSNAGKEEIDIIYKDKIDDIFDVITVSYEAGVIKPEAEIYLICAKRLGLEPEECVFVDDSKINLEAAEKLGMATIYYPDFGLIPNELKSLIE